jgi:hypothetical protein
LCYPEIMKTSIRVIPKKRGRPKTTGRGVLIGVRMQTDLLARLDAWMASTGAESRPEAMRQLLEHGLGAPPKRKPR